MDNRIRMVREALELSQREFGERLGVSRDVISNLEYGRVQPKELVIKHICDLYGVNEQWIKDGNGPMFSSPPRNNKKLEEAVSIFQSLRPNFKILPCSKSVSWLSFRKNRRARFIKCTLSLLILYSQGTIAASS